MASRTERSLFADWWWTVDRWLLASLFALMLCGIVFLMGGGPPVAERLGLSTFHFVHRQIAWLSAATIVMIAVSFLSPRHVRRLALAVYVVGMALVVATLLFGVEVKGARRWITLAGLNIQPSEFVKPAFVVLAAWAFSEGSRRQDMPGTWLGVLLLACDNCAARHAAGYRSDDAPVPCLGRIILSGRVAHVLGRRAWQRRGRRTGAGIFVFSSCHKSYQPISGQGCGRR